MLALLRERNLEVLDTKWIWGAEMIAHAKKINT
jgi:hypothetical protein